MSVAGVVVLETDQDYLATTMLFGKVVPVGDHYAALDHNGSTVGVVERTGEDYEFRRWKWTSLDGSSYQHYTSLQDALRHAAKYVGTIL